MNRFNIFKAYRDEVCFGGNKFHFVWMVNIAPFYNRKVEGDFDSAFMGKSFSARSTGSEVVDEIRRYRRLSKNFTHLIFRRVHDI